MYNKKYISILHKNYFSLYTIPPPRFVNMQHTLNNLSIPVWSSSLICSESERTIKTEIVPCNILKRFLTRPITRSTCILVDAICLDVSISFAASCFFPPVNYGIINSTLHCDANSSTKVKPLSAKI